MRRINELENIRPGFIRRIKYHNDGASQKIYGMVQNAQFPASGDLLTFSRFDLDMVYIDTPITLPTPVGEGPVLSRNDFAVYGGKVYIIWDRGAAKDTVEVLVYTTEGEFEDTFEFDFSDHAGSVIDAAIAVGTLGVHVAIIQRDIQVGDDDWRFAIARTNFSGGSQSLLVNEEDTYTAIGGSPSASPVPDVENLEVSGWIYVSGFNHRHNQDLLRYTTAGSYVNGRRLGSDNDSVFMSQDGLGFGVFASVGVAFSLILYKLTLDLITTASTAISDGPSHFTVSLDEIYLRTALTVSNSYDAYDFTLSFVDTRVAENELGPQTIFFAYQNGAAPESLGAPDGGVAVPALQALAKAPASGAAFADGADFLPENDYIQMRTAIEALAPFYKNAVTGNRFNWTNGSADNLYFVAMGDRTKYGATGGAKYDWTHDLATLRGQVPYDIDIGEIEECIAKLEASDLV
jgi:hypothetical protein